MPEAKPIAMEAKKPDGSEDNPFPWVAPFPHRKHLDPGQLEELAADKEKLKTKDPASLSDEEKDILAHDGREDLPVFVKAKVLQDLRINGSLAPGGQHVVLDSDTAHAHARALGAPDPAPVAVQEDEEDDKE
jgi:hypothetical protein